MKYIVLSTVLGLATLSGCAGTPMAPRELVDARAALARANQGPASRLALVDLHNAQTDLDRAERSFRDHPNEPVTRDLSYVALRHAQIAEAHGDTLQANQDREHATNAQVALTGERLQQTQAALQGSQAALQGSQQAVAMTQQQLAEERTRREAAERQAAAAVESLRRVAAVREEARGMIITLSGEVLFATGQSTLLPIAQQRLDQVAHALMDQGGRHLVVEGYTDSRGSAADNQALSLSRAQAVRNYLISRGIPDSQIEANGMGPSNPVATNDTAEGRANNRRVQIVVSPSAHPPPAMGSNANQSNPSTANATRP